jgi:hypothetical protein
MNRSSLAFLSLLACAASAGAAEEILEFKLVTMPVEVKAIDAKNIEGQSVGLMKAHGVASFKDGRVASKEFVYSWDQLKGAGPFYGYSVYTFEDGSSITARFAGTVKTGQPMHGDYTIVSGTGMYAGAKGTGSFDALPHKLSGANLFSGRFAVSTP